MNIWMNLWLLIIISHSLCEQEQALEMLDSTDGLKSTIWQMGLKLFIVAATEIAHRYKKSIWVDVRFPTSTQLFITHLQLQSQM